MKNCFHFILKLFKGAVAADLVTKSVLGYFLFYFQAIPASQQKHTLYA